MVCALCLLFVVCCLWLVGLLLLFGGVGSSLSLFGLVVRCFVCSGLFVVVVGLVACSRLSLLCIWLWCASVCSLLLVWLLCVVIS